MEKPCILLVSPDGAVTETFRKHLTYQKLYQVVVAKSAGEAEFHLQESGCALVLLDHNLPEDGAARLLRSCRQDAEPVPALLLIPKGDRARETSKEQLQEFMLQDKDLIAMAIDRVNLLARVDAALTASQERHDLWELRQEHRSQYSFDAIKGSSSKLQEVIAAAKRIAPNLGVLIRGESGTGKELFAAALHTESPRCDHSFLAKSCAALPETLLEAELFGSVAGAYTDAKNQFGLFEVADKGTLFLDEVGRASPKIQDLLLRVLETGELNRVGCRRIRRVQVRVVAATNEPLEKMVENGQFREDLFYRIAQKTIVLPPLRERLEDIQELTLHFVNRFMREYKVTITEIEEEVLAVLKSHTWPGNVRELRDTIHQVVYDRRGANVRACDIADELQSRQSLLPLDPNRVFRGTQKDVEREYMTKYLLKLLEWHKGDRDKMAKQADVHVSTLRHWLKDYGLSQRV